jgi:hypothetical protein
LMSYDRDWMDGEEEGLEGRDEKGKDDKGGKAGRDDKVEEGEEYDEKGRDDK